MLPAATECKIQVSGAASTAGAVQAGTSGVTRSGPLVVEPGAGFSPVYRLIDGARRGIDMTMYEFSDTTAEHDLAAAAKRADVSAITAVFDADFNGKAVHPGDGRDLTWSPTDSQDRLLGLRRLLHPRQGGRGRLRHRARQGLHRLGEFLRHLEHSRDH